MKKQKLHYIVVLSSICITLAFPVNAISKCKGNLGHLLGYDFYKKNEGNSHLPENSLIIFKQALVDDLHKDTCFEYYETDIQESLDHEIILLHDATKNKDLSRMIPFNEHNKKILNVVLDDFKNRGFKKKPKLKDIRIKHLKKNEIKWLVLKNERQQTNIDYQVPTLNQILSLAKKNNLNVKILIEIKKIQSASGKKRLLEIINEFKNNQSLNIDLIVRFEKRKELIFRSTGLIPKMKNKLVGGINSWCADLSNYKLFISKTGKKHDLCRDLPISDIRSYTPYKITSIK